MKRADSRHNDFATALKKIRVTKALSQEDFSLVSSRTYVSSLERGIYSPTLNKVDELAEVLDVHPLVLLAMSYSKRSNFKDVSTLIEKFAADIAKLD